MILQPSISPYFMHTSQTYLLRISGHLQVQITLVRHLFTEGMQSIFFPSDYCLPMLVIVVFHLALSPIVDIYCSGCGFSKTDGIRLYIDLS